MRQTKPTSLDGEKLLPLIPAIEQASGQRPHISTAIRFASRGSYGVLLESTSLGNKYLTSVEAVKRFMAAVAAARGGTANTSSLTPRQETLAANRAAKQLAERLEVSRK